MDITTKGVPTRLKGWNLNIYLSVQRWLTGHNRLEVTRFRALSFRGDELEKMTKGSPYLTGGWDLGAYRFRGD